MSVYKAMDWDSVNKLFFRNREKADIEAKKQIDRLNDIIKKRKEKE